MAIPWYGEIHGMEWLGQPYYGMAKNSREGNQARKKRYYQALAERGIRPLQVLAPEAAHPLIKQAISLMTREVDPVDPRIAMRQAGGANEPEPREASPELTAALEAAKARIAEVERQRKALETERDAARAAEAAALEDVRLAAAEAHTARQRGQEAQEKAEAAHNQVEKARERATAALERAERAEATVLRAKSLPGLRGRLMRWMAGDVLD